MKVRQVYQPLQAKRFSLGANLPGTIPGPPRRMINCFSVLTRPQSLLLSSRLVNVHLLPTLNALTCRLANTSYQPRTIFSLTCELHRQKQTTWCT